MNKDGEKFIPDATTPSASMLVHQQAKNLHIELNNLLDALYTISDIPEGSVKNISSLISLAANQTLQIRNNCHELYKNLEELK